jgi:hypothetical protein
MSVIPGKQVAIGRRIMVQAGSREKQKTVSEK